MHFQTGFRIVFQALLVIVWVELTEVKNYCVDFTIDFFIQTFKNALVCFTWMLRHMPCYVPLTHSISPTCSVVADKSLNRFSRQVLSLRHPFDLRPIMFDLFAFLVTPLLTKVLTEWCSHVTWVAKRAWTSIGTASCAFTKWMSRKGSSKITTCIVTRNNLLTGCEVTWWWIELLSYVNCIRCC